MGQLLITNATVVLPDRLVEDSAVLVANGKIARLCRSGDDDSLLDLAAFAVVFGNLKIEVVEKEYAKRTRDE